MYRHIVPFSAQMLRKTAETAVEFETGVFIIGASGCHINNFSNSGGKLWDYSLLILKITPTEPLRKTVCFNQRVKQ